MASWTTTDQTNTTEGGPECVAVSKGPEDFTSLVQQLGVDPVMVQLADQRLRGQGQQSCVVCENRDATSLCHDCQEQYCDGCAKVHRRQGLTKDHVLQTLPQEEEFMFGAGAPSSQVTRRQPVATQQSGTSPTPQPLTTQQFGKSPTPQPVTTQQSGIFHTKPALPSPASTPASQRPSNTQLALIFTSVLFVGLYTGVVLHTCFHSPKSLLPSVDPMKASPRRAFTMSPTCDDDEETPWITSIVSIEDGQRLVMSDYNNRKVKVVDMRHPHNVSASLTLNESPWSLAALPDKLIAVTTKSKMIYLLRVIDAAMTVTSRITTEVEYHGIAGHSDGNLIVGCRREANNGVARIDLLNRSGRVVRTLADSHSLTQLGSPLYLYSTDNHVFVSDLYSDTVFQVSMNKGQMLDTMTHTELKYPRQITVDTSGHLYIAGDGSHAVLVRSPSGQWRILVMESLHMDQGFDHPCGVCVTSSGRLFVAWYNQEMDQSLVIAYHL